MATDSSSAKLVDLLREHEDIEDVFVATDLPEED